MGSFLTPLVHLRVNGVLKVFGEGMAALQSGNIYHLNFFGICCRFEMKMKIFIKNEIKLMRKKT